MTKEDAPASEETTARRSSRIASQPKPPSSAAPPKEKKPRGKKRTTEESAGEEAAAEDEENGEAPAKKAKPASKAASKPASKAAKPASKTEEKPESKAEKPASKAKPTSKAKPASKGKPASKSKPTSKAKAESEAAATSAAGATDTIMEEPEENAPAAEEAAKPAEPEAPAAAEPAETAKEPEAPAETSKEAEAAAEAPAEASSSSSKELQVGDVLPSLTLPNQSGTDVDIGALAKEQGVILFLVPKANTPGCTTQACGFRDIYQDFTGLDYAVYSLSADSTKVLTSWQNKQTLPYPLLSDPKRTLISLLGAASGNSTKRSHFIFEKGTGKLLDKQIGVKPADSPKAALEFVKKHAGSS
ncbi:AhpC/TSA domain-containing protein [Ceratobasidium sp. AG-Ba]|nr:AhpC/TSA domain-containing protein [Ceratobasidium sp. AG-Ba]